MTDEQHLCGRPVSLGGFGTTCGAPIPRTSCPAQATACPYRTVAVVQPSSFVNLLAPDGPYAQANRDAINAAFEDAYGGTWEQAQADLRAAATGPGWQRNRIALRAEVPGHPGLWRPAKPLPAPLAVRARRRITNLRQRLALRLAPWLEPTDDDF